MKQIVALLCVGLLLVGCGSGVEQATEPLFDNTQIVEQYYKDHPERFTFATKDDLPTNLVWQNGEKLSPFADPNAQRGGRITLRVQSMQQTLRVLGPDANSSLRAPLWNANSVPLIQWHPIQQGYYPGLAERWALDPENPNRMFFQLDPEARWSDGKPFTVEDVRFSLYFLLSSHIADPAVNRVFDENISNITQFDERTLSVTLSKPDPDPLFDMTSFILVQRDFYREFGPDYVERYHWRFSPVTGPYVLDEQRLKKGQQITFVRLDDWWANDKRFYKNRFNPDQLTFVAIRDDSKAFEAFLLGDISWHSLSETKLWYDRASEKAIQSGYIERAVAYHLLPAPRQGLYMNSLSSRLVDKNIRRGLQHVINFEQVNDGLYRGDRRRIKSFVDGYGEYDHPTLKARDYDLQAATGYFALAGYQDRNDIGVLVNTSGDPLSFELLVENSADELTIATILKENARFAGVELRIETLDPTANFTKIFEKNYELALHAWNTGYSPRPGFEWELRGADAGQPSNFNTTNIREDELDALLAEWDVNTDDERGLQLAHGVQERIHEYASWVPGLTVDYSRYGYWRWIRWPEYFQVPRRFFFLESGVFWIDEARRQETLTAIDNDQTFSSQPIVYEQFKR